MLSFGWFPLVLQPPSPPVPLIILLFLPRLRYLTFFSHPFSFILWSAGTAKSTILQILFFVVHNFKIWYSGQDKVIPVCSIIVTIIIIIIIIIVFSASFSQQLSWIVFHWSLNGSMFPGVSGLFLIFWPISTMLFELSQFAFRFPILWATFQSLKRQFQDNYFSDHRHHLV